MYNCMLYMLLCVTAITEYVTEVTEYITEMYSMQRQSVAYNCVLRLYALLNIIPLGGPMGIPYGDIFTLPGNG